MLESDEKQFSPGLVNISSKFKVVTANYNLIKQSKFFECCTVLDKLRIKCAKAAINKSPLLNLNNLVLLGSISFSKLFLV